MKRLSVKWICFWGLAIVIALLYNDWLLGPILNPHMSSVRSLISELSALSQPYHTVFQTLDITAGILTLLFVGFVWRFTSSMSKKERWVLTGLIAFIGLDSIVDASLPIRCAPSVDIHCSLLAFNSAVTDAHLIESNIAGVGIAIAPIIWWWLHRENSPRFAKVSLSFALLQILAGVFALIVRISGKDKYGLIQRIYEGGLGIWIATILGTSATKYSDKTVSGHEPEGEINQESLSLAEG